ncbi:hypothetical protein KCU74_g141, partial [Aureobasidium melanogenum]
LEGCRGNLCRPGDMRRLKKGVQRCRSNLCSVRRGLRYPVRLGMLYDFSIQSLISSSTSSFSAFAQAYVSAGDASRTGTHLEFSDSFLLKYSMVPIAMSLFTSSISYSETGDDDDGFGFGLCDFAHALQSSGGTSVLVSHMSAGTVHDLAWFGFAPAWDCDEDLLVPSLDGACCSPVARYLTEIIEVRYGMSASRRWNLQLGQRLLMRHIKKFPEERDRDEKLDVAIVPWRIGLEGRNDYVGVYIWEGSMMSITATSWLAWIPISTISPINHIAEDVTWL